MPAFLRQLVLALPQRNRFVEPPHFGQLQRRAVYAESHLLVIADGFGKGDFAAKGIERGAEIPHARPAIPDAEVIRSGVAQVAAGLRDVQRFGIGFLGGRAIPAVILSISPRLERLQIR